MQCHEFAQFLEQEPDGPLPALAADHLDHCSRCRLLFSDLEGIRLASFEWAVEEPVPPSRVWVALRAQLEAEGLIRNNTPAREPEPARTGLWPTWAIVRAQAWAMRPALLGVSLSVLLAAAGLLHVQGDLPGNIVRGSMIPETSLGAPLADEIDRTLDSEMRRVMASLPARSPSLTSALQQNLAIVDNMIATCEKSVREQPDNPMAREYLYGAYQEKAVLLSTAMEHTTLEAR